MMNIEKSTRHQHIIGKFGEYLLCNWLSRTGFEVVLVDHTGIDVIAYRPKTKKRIGVTVKSRTRNLGSETTQVNLLSYRQGKDDRKRVLDACIAFGCEPWIAVYVETSKYSELFLTSLENYDKKYRISERRALDTWKMSSKYKTMYLKDKEVKYMRADYNGEGWQW
jgi:hypothetical protein